MEACGSAHHWGRMFQEAGRMVRLINPYFVRPFVRGSKNDATDAQAIFEAAGRPTMHFVPVKSLECQDLQSLHRIRDRLVHNRTSLINHTRGLLAEYGISLTPVRLSSLLEERDLTEQVEACLNALPRVIEVFNRAVFDLSERGIDPLLHPLADDYLPLRISCASDATRLPLRRRDGPGGAYAVATCGCGATYRFRLGRRELSFDEIVQTHRWSPDVLLPTLVNDLASGVVAGKSSAIYGMVLNRVLREALDKEPIPMLVPEGLSRAPDGTHLVADSLMVSYLLGR
jgi:hypothetical protein